MALSTSTKFGSLAVTEGIADGANGASRKARVGGTLKTTTTQTTHTNTTTEAAIASHLIPAGSLVANTRLDIKFMLFAPTTGTSTTAIWRIRIGPTTATGTPVAAGTATDVADNNKAHGMLSLYGVAAAGADVGYRVHGWYVEFGSTTVVPIYDVATTGLATNGTLRVELCIDLSAADATTIRCDAFSVDIHDTP